MQEVWLGWTHPRPDSWYDNMGWNRLDFTTYRNIIDKWVPISHPRSVTLETDSVNGMARGNFSIRNTVDHFDMWGTTPEITSNAIRLELLFGENKDTEEFLATRAVRAANDYDAEFFVFSTQWRRSNYCNAILGRSSTDYNNLHKHLVYVR